MDVAAIGLAIFVVTILFGIPFAYSLGIVGFGGVVYILGWEKSIELLPTVAAGFITNYTFGAVILFVLMGYLATEAGVTKDVFEVAYKWVGRLSGGLITAAIAACTMFGAVTGLNFAAIGALGKPMIDEMRKRHYKENLAAATVAAAANLGALIPPSILAIFYAFFMDLSAGRQILAGLIPGLLTMSIYTIYVMARAKRNPQLAPPATDITWRDSFSVTPKIWGMALLFLIVVGGLYLGWFTATEAGAIGAAIALILLLLRKRSPWGHIKRALGDTVRLCGMIFAIFVGASLMKFFFTVSGFSQDLTVFLNDLNLPVWQLSLLLAVPWLILGMFIDTVTIMLITLPVYKPIMLASNIDMLLWGVLFIKLVGIASLSPPFGFNVIFTHGIQPDISLWSIYKESIRFVLLDMVIIALILLFPVIVHFIPDLM